MSKSHQAPHCKNLIGGERLPSIGAGVFESVAARAPHNQLPNCPRSDARDLEQLYEQRLSKRRMGADRAIDLLEDVAYALEDQLAQGVGLVRAQAVRIGHTLSKERSFDQQLDRLDASADASRSSGVTVCVLPWCAQPGEMLERVGQALLTSQLVILASDERAPFLADLMGQLLLECEWPAERFAVLHALQDDAFVLAARRGARLCGRVDRTRLKRLRTQLEGAQGVLLDVARTRTMVINERSVAREHSYADLAQRLVGEALEPLGGQAHASLGSIHVAPEVFAPVEEAFVEAFEQHPLVLTPGPVIDRAADEAMAVRVGQGLDEGATQISAKRPGGERSSESRPRRRSGVKPALFTNAEPRSRLVLEDRPLPVVTLVRAPAAKRS